MGKCLVDWEKITEFSNIRNQAGSNGFVLTVKQWVERTNAIGITSAAGRYGGTYAHRDIAMEFASWLSPEFKYYMVRELQRLKSDENNRLKLNWSLQRTLSKINYRIHTDAIKEKSAYCARRSFLVKSEMRSLKLGTAAIALSNVLLGILICGGGD